MNDFLIKQLARVYVKDENNIFLRLLQLLHNYGIDKLDKRQQAVLYRHVFSNKNVPSVDADVYCKDRSLLVEAETGHDDYIDILLIARDLVNERTTSNKTLLHLSSEIGDLELVDIFLKAGADVDDKNEYGDTALHFSANNGYVEIVKILLKAGANVNAKNQKNETPLHLSASCGYIEIVAILLKGGANVNAINEYNNTPLHLGASFGYIEIVAILLKAGANVNTKNKYNDTPLHSSAHYGYIEIVEILLKIGANVNAKNQKNETPLHLSVRKGRYEIVEILLKAGANVEKEDINRFPVLKDLYNRTETKSMGTLARIRNWMTSVTNTTKKVRRSASITTIVSYTETTSVTFPAQENQFLSPGTRASHNELVGARRTSVSSETLVKESIDACSGVVSTVATSSSRSRDTHNPELPWLHNISQQIQDQFSPQVGEGWQTTSSAAVEPAYRNGKVVMPTTVHVTNNKTIIYKIQQPTYNISDAQNIACSGPFYLKNQAGVSTTDDSFTSSSDSEE